MAPVLWGALSFAAQKPAASGNPGDLGACPGSLLPQLTLLATWVHMLLCLEGLQHKILNCSSKHKFSSPAASSPVGLLV